jgi:hypothetical protein
MASAVLALVPPLLNASGPGSGVFDGGRDAAGTTEQEAESGVVSGAIRHLDRRAEVERTFIPQKVQRGLPPSPADLRFAHRWTPHSGAIATYPLLDSGRPPCKRHRLPT